MIEVHPKVHQPFEGMTLPLRVIFGMQEEVEEVGGSEVARTIYGRTIVLPCPWESKLSFRLSNSGNDVLVPPAAAFRLGSIVNYNRVTWDMGSLPTSTKPGRRVVEGANVKDTSGKFHLFYRTTHTCIVTTPLSTSTDVTGRTSGWSVEFEELD